MAECVLHESQSAPCMNKKHILLSLFFEYS